jgi:uncharacterized protein YpmS
MKISHRMGWLSVLILILFLSSLACNLPGREPATETPLPTIPVSTEAVASLQDTLNAAKDAFENNQTVEITVNESQLTSLVARELESDPEIPLTDPQIYLLDGQVTLIASLTQNQIAVPVEIVLVISTDGQGNPEYKVIIGQVGPLPVPENLMNRLTSRLDESIANWTRVDDRQVFVESIAVGDGNLTLRGFLR